MAGTLTFAVNDTLKSIVEHAAANDPGPFYGEKIERCVFLVKDQGTYLMSGGKPSQIDPAKGEPRCLVLYANEINPDTMDFDDWYELQRDICGGDDFVEPLDLAFFQRAIERGVKEIEIKLEEDSIQLAG